MRKFVVEYAVNGHVDSRTVRCDDEGCAVGILLDEKEDDEVTYDWIKIQPAIAKLPDGVERAYEAALGRVSR